MQFMSIKPLPPFMMRLNGIDVYQCTRFILTKIIANNHSIYFSKYELRLLLKIYGIIYYPPIRMTIKEKLDKPNLMLELNPMW